MYQAKVILFTFLYFLTILNYLAANKEKYNNNFNVNFTFLFNFSILAFCSDKSLISGIMYSQVF